jgi:uncharacterized protein YoxC
MYALPIAVSDTHNVISPVTTDSSTSDMKHRPNEVALDVNVESYDLDTLFESINPELIRTRRTLCTEQRAALFL